MTSPVPEANEAAEVVHRERAADRAVERPREVEQVETELDREPREVRELGERLKASGWRKIENDGASGTDTREGRDDE